MCKEIFFRLKTSVVEEEEEEEEENGSSLEKVEVWETSIIQQTTKKA